MNNPSTLTLKELRKDWPLVEKTEYWQRWGRGGAGIRKDLFGFGDFIAVREDWVLLVQATSWANVSARVKKIRSLEAHKVWLWSRHRSIEVWGWKKKDGRWIVKKVEVEVVKEDRPVMEFSSEMAGHPVLAAMAIEWSLIQATMAYVEITPRVVYEKMRKVVKEKMEVK